MRLCSVHPRLVPASSSSANITAASTFNRLGQYAISPSKRDHCYVEAGTHTMNLTLLIVQKRPQQSNAP